MTEPAVGASTCASGNQVCTGHIGIFTANDAKNASHAQVCSDRGTAVCISVGMSVRSEEHTSELQSQSNLVCRLLLEKKKKKKYYTIQYSRKNQKKKTK